ncbi:Hpt domain protein [compost metagenome]
MPAELQRCLEEKNYKLAVEIVHKIKGSSGNIGAKQMYEAAGFLQSALTDNREDEISELCSRFYAALEELYSEIEAYLQVSDSDRAPKFS